MADAIVLPDSQATPVNHTFTPTNVTPKRVEYSNFAVAHGIGRETLSITLDDSGKIRRGVMLLKDPRLITESINGVDVPSAPDYGWVKIEAAVPQTWEDVAGEDLVEMAKNLLGNADVIAMITKGISPAA